ncbi:MAG: DUF2911 domain-containing protein [Candidatus Solibacter sp.]
MRNRFVKYAGIVSVLTATAIAQQQTAATIDGNAITVKYAAPAAKNRAAASFQTPADLAFKGVNVPKGEYTIYVLADGEKWQLAVNSATGPKAATYDPKLDLGRLPMTMSKAPAPAAACKMTLTKIAALAAKLEVSWNDTIATVSFHLDRGGSDSEW